MVPIYLLKKGKVKGDASQANAQTTSSKQEECDSDDDSLVEFLGMHILEECHTTTNPDEILDSGSTITVARNKKEFKDLRPCERNIIMATNVGSKKINYQGKWKEWGETYLVPDTIRNIVSVSRIVKKGFRVVLDTDRENTFYVVDKKNKAIRFPCDVRGLYARSSDPPVDCREYNLNTSVEGYTKREVERAIAAQKFYHDLNAENLANMKAFI